MKKLINGLCVLVLLLGGFASIACSQVDNEVAAFYVAPAGDDANAGTYEDPFATLERARDAVRKLKQEEGFPEGGVTVYLRGGQYTRRTTFRLGPEDSGNPGAPVKYSAYKGEEISLMGGVELDTSGFKPVIDKAILNRLPEKSRGEVYQMDLSDKDVDYGKLPFTGHSLAHLPWLPRRDPAPELLFNGDVMTLARWPNDGFARIGSVITEGTLPQDDDAPKTEDYSGAVFEYTGDRPERWTEAEDVWLFGYWGKNWSDQTIQLEQIDPDRGTIITREPSAYGVQEGQRYYAYNLLEEIDTPGEWYLDRENGILYFYPPGDLDGADVQFSQLTTPMIVMEGTSHITLDDFIIEASRGPAITIRGGEGNVVDSCTIRGIANKAVTVDGGTDNGIVGCSIYDIGGEGIDITGGDREQLIAAGNYAKNNHIYDFARLRQTYAPAVSLSGVGNRALHNKMHDAPHMAIGFAGNNHKIAYNEVFDVAKQTDDAGAIYAGRTWTSRGNVIRHNFFHDIQGIDAGHGAMAVYLDDGFSGTRVEGNVFFNIPGRSILVGGGHKNMIKNNLFINCDRPLSIDDRLLDWGSHHVENLMKGLDKYMRFDAWKEEYPELKGILEAEPSPGVPKDNVIKTNILYNSGDVDITEKAETYGTVVNNLKTDRDPGFLNADARNFRIANDSWIYKELPEFKPIPFHLIGLHDE